MRSIIQYIFVFIVLSFLFAIPSNALLDGFISGCLNDAGWTPSHTATLSIEQGGVSVPTIDTETWIFVCITRGTDSYCTTGGNGSLDTNLFGSDGHYRTLTTMTGLDGYVGGVQTGSNPTRTNNDATNPQFVETIVWGDAYVPGVVHQWSWVQRSLANSGAGVQGNESALQ
jgi:hypothetical protein